MVPITWDKIGMKILTKRSFFSTSTKTVPINFTSMFSSRYLCCQSDMEVNLDDSAIGDNIFYWSILNLVFSLLFGIQYTC